MMINNKKKRVLFYYLSAFSNTGGIEKFNRCFIKALNEIAEEGAIDPVIVSVYDHEGDERYTDKFFFRGFDKKRASSLRHVVKAAFKTDILIIGHINLAIAGVLVKIIRPKCKVFMVAHGIEVWGRMFFVKKWSLNLANFVLSVSNYTKNQLVLRNKITPKKILLFPNTIDPYFSVPKTFEKPQYLFERYGLSKGQPVILTLSRIVSSEKYKGYDKVIAALPGVIKYFPEIVYILAGKYDEAEKQRVNAVIELYKVAKNVILTGYLPEDEIKDHYSFADVFIMPSRKEGFGIVYLEALACGTPVIGGNQDGTVDALLNGSLGKLINPTKVSEISLAIVDMLTMNHQHSAYQENVLKQYQFGRYKNRLLTYLNL